MNSNDLSKLLGEIQKCDPTRYSEDTQAYQQWKADKILVPQKGAKKIAYESEEIFYGGGVGGGKTMLAIGMSLTKNYHTAIFRTTNNQFGGMQKEYERLLKHVPQKKVSSRGVKASDRYVSFIGLHRSNAIYNIHGNSYDLVVFYEATYHRPSDMEHVTFWHRPFGSTSAPLKCFYTIPLLLVPMRVIIGLRKRCVIGKIPTILCSDNMEKLDS